MELYAKIEKGPADPEVGIITAAWCNNVGRFFSALQKAYGRCVGHYAIDGQAAGWRFQKRVGNEVMTITVRLLTPCPITDPQCVKMNRMKVPYKPFILKSALPAPRNRRRAA